MTYRNYRNSLNKQMLSYLRFMKHADTDQQLLELHAEVSELRTNIHNLDQFTASQMQETVIFNEVVYESFGFPDFHIKSENGRPFKNRKSLLSNVDRRDSEFTGVSFNRHNCLWVATVSYKGKEYLRSHHKLEIQAAVARDEAIIKFYLPLPLQVLKKPQKP